MSKDNVIDLKKPELFIDDQITTIIRQGYILIWLKPGDDYNDFGQRSCPFCGLLTDELTGNVIA